MSRPRPDTLDNREPAAKPEPDAPQERNVDEDERVAFTSWDCPLVPPLTRRDQGERGS